MRAKPVVVRAATAVRAVPAVTVVRGKPVAVRAATAVRAVTARRVHRDRRVCRDRLVSAPCPRRARRDRAHSDRAVIAPPHRVTGSTVASRLSQGLATTKT